MEDNTKQPLKVDYTNKKRYMTNFINQYIQAIDAIYQTGETTEHSFRGTLETLMKSLLPKSKKNVAAIQIINEPKRKEYGAPDFELRKGDAIVSFIETKDLFDKDLRGENDKAKSNTSMVCHLKL